MKKKNKDSNVVEELATVNAEFSSEIKKKRIKFTKKKIIILSVIGILIIAAVTILIIALINKNNNELKELSVKEYQARVYEYGDNLRREVIKFVETNNKYPTHYDLMYLVEQEDLSCYIDFDEDTLEVSIRMCDIEGYKPNYNIVYLFTIPEISGEPKPIDPKDAKEERQKLTDKLDYDGVNYNQNLEYKMTGNSFDNFDLYFLKRNNEEVNKIYSPLAVKYALLMLSDGANGETKAQINNVLGSYKYKKYTNSSNMSLANALFIKDSYKDSIKSSYINTVSSKYNADVINDSFKTPDAVNAYVSKKTYDLIKDVASDISNFDYILLNTVAIDMEWVNKIQSEFKDYNISYPHRRYTFGIAPLNLDGYTEFDFYGSKEKATGVDLGAVANRYDIVKAIGEENIRATVTKEYEKWYAENPCEEENPEPVDSYMEHYMKEIKQGYKDISSSTDFMFYKDENVTVIAKDLKKYNGTTLQYVGIMPSGDLESYIKETDAKSINTLIGNLKSIELNSFDEGVITEIYATIPLFSFDYTVDLINYLKGLGIINIFDKTKADLSNLTTSQSNIDKVEQSTTIDFTNDGIKAASAVMTGGAGDLSCGFDYRYEVPVKKINLTFNRPYMFIIRDKDTGEVWFTGTIYNPQSDMAEPSLN